MEIKTIKELFNPLYSRLYEIKSCQVQFPEPYDLEENFISSLKPEIYLYPEENSLPHVELALNIIEEINELGKDIVKNLEVPAEGWYNTFDEHTTMVNGEDYFKSTIEEYRSVTIKKLKTELTYYSNFLTELQQNLIVRIKKASQNASNKLSNGEAIKNEDKKSAGNNSFKYKGDLRNINDLRTSLIKKGFIEEQTKLTDFRKVFAGEVVTNKIRWTSYIAYLAYFIKLIYVDLEKVAIDNDGAKQKHWIVTSLCFVDKDGKAITHKQLREADDPSDMESLAFIVRNL